jgi:hypothetical protein
MSSYDSSRTSHFTAQRRTLSRRPWRRRRIAYSREYFEGATSIWRQSDMVRHTHSRYLAIRESGR